VRDLVTVACGHQAPRSRPHSPLGLQSEDKDWDWGKLLPSGLFSASADPGLLTINFGWLSQEVCKVMK